MVYIEYKKIALDSGVEAYERVPALGVSNLFIESLSKIILKINKDEVYQGGLTENNTRICPLNYLGCRFEAGN